MTAFDPAAATAAYLATFPPQAHARAIAYTQGGHWLLLWGWLVSLTAYAVILYSRVLARVEIGLERRKPRPLLVSAVVAALFTGLEFSWTLYANWWRETQYGLTSQAFGGWAGEQLIGLVVNLILSVLFLMALYALIRRAPRTWWVWAGGLACVAIVFLIVISPVLIEPLFNRYTPAPNGPVREAVVALAKKAGVPSDKIYVYNGSKQSNRYTANVSGLLGSARVAMSDTMFAQGADLHEVRGVVGHEMGHYKHLHVIWFAVTASVLAVLMFWLADRLFPLLAARLYARVDSIADPAGLPLLAAIISTFVLLATPILNTATRMQEADADRFSLKTANEPDGLAAALVKTIGYRAASPSPVEEFIFYDHPSVSRRIRRAMDWKATHPGPG